MDVQRATDEQFLKKTFSKYTQWCMTTSLTKIPACTIYYQDVMVTRETAPSEELFFQNILLRTDKKWGQLFLSQKKKLTYR